MAKGKTKATSRRVFRESDQTKIFDKSVEEEVKEQRARKVECLGMTFDNDEARREHFLKKLAEKLKDPEFRKIEGFPIGTDEDILALSDPPYYTACPNPFLAEFIRRCGKPYDSKTDTYRREPFAADISEGKNDPIYMAHAYHTKVPHKAIMRYILHYTEPGDVVLDGFCGTGMMGVAAGLCGSKSEVESFGYQVKRDGTITDAEGNRLSCLGIRARVLNDLCPAASFIACNYNRARSQQVFLKYSLAALRKAESECAWMYATLHEPSKTQIEEAVARVVRSPADLLAVNKELPLGRINYVVWSDVFTCPECTGEIVFWDAAVNKKTWQVQEPFHCPHCRTEVDKRALEAVFESRMDTETRSMVKQKKQVPTLIHYYVGKKKHIKKPDRFDLALLAAIDRLAVPHWVPTQRMPEGDEARRNDAFGITHVHQFYTKRNLWALAAFAEAIGPSREFVNVTSVGTIISKLYRFRSQNQSLGAGGGPLVGTLYVPSLSKEIPILKALGEHVEKWSRLQHSLPQDTGSCTTTGSHTSLPQVPANSVDYIFTDPPFGANYMYSELNFIWESWLRVTTNTVPEAIQNDTQHKGLFEYQALMTASFSECCRVMKPGRWITVEFHNSQNSVWNAIQEALQHAGFVIADVRTLDKKQTTFKQVTSAGAVKQDLIISAYKPNGGLEGRFKLEAGTAEGVWDFVRTHLKQLPVFVAKGEEAEVVAERQNYLLYDRMVAFHVQRGVMVPLSAAECYDGLTQRFSDRDGMYFLSEQAAEYDRKRMTVKRTRQLDLFVKDESSAILWLQRLLKEKPQTFQDVQPQFMREIVGWEQFEKTLELMELLEENFLCYDGQGEVPSQIHTYLSSNFHDLRNLSCGAPALRVKAKDRWYVPDTRKAEDLEQLREHALLKEFWDYLPSGYHPAKLGSPQAHIPGLEPAPEPLPSGRRLKIIRLEAVRAGFKHCWGNRDYRTIIAVAHRIPENVLQEDPKLLMWYDQALTRSGEVQ